MLAYSGGSALIALSITGSVIRAIKLVATESQTDLSRLASIRRSNSPALAQRCVGFGNFLSKVTRLGWMYRAMLSTRPSYETKALSRSTAIGSQGASSFFPNRAHFHWSG